MKTTGLHKLVLLALIFFSLSAFSSGYKEYLGDVHQCLGAMKTGGFFGWGKRYDMDQVRGVLSGKVTSVKGCSAAALKPTASILKSSHDCAKTAVGLRNQYLKSQGKPVAIPDSILHRHLSTMAIGERWKSKRRFFSHLFSFKEANLDASMQSQLGNVKVGDMLFFENKCPRRKKNPFYGHVMTVTKVRRGFTGLKFDVIEGHLAGAKPTYRTLKASKIWKNGKTGRGIGDLGCVRFRGVTTWNAEKPEPEMRLAQALH